MSQDLTLTLLLCMLAMAIGLGVVLFLINKKQRLRVDGLFFESQQGPIFYQLHGKKGSYVVLIHGLGASTYCWRNIVPDLADKYRVLAFDLWGFGHSSKELKSPMTLENQIAVIQELLKHLKIGHYHVVGHSMGGELSLWLKKHDPKVEKCLVLTPAIYPELVSAWLRSFHWVANWTPLILNKNSIRRFLNRTMEDPAFVTEDMVDHYYEPYQDPKAHLCFAAALNIIRDHRVYHSLDEIEVDLVIWAAHDAVISRKHVRIMAEKVRTKRMLTHPWSGHIPMEDDPHWVAKQLLLSLEP